MCVYCSVSILPYLTSVVIANMNKHIHCSALRRVADQAVVGRPGATAGPSGAVVVSLKQEEWRMGVASCVATFGYGRNHAPAHVSPRFCF